MLYKSESTIYDEAAAAADDDNVAAPIRRLPSKFGQRKAMNAPLSSSSSSNNTNTTINNNNNDNFDEIKDDKELEQLFNTAQANQQSNARARRSPLIATLFRVAALLVLGKTVIDGLAWWRTKGGGASLEVSFFAFFLFRQR
jgi:hypothetical protein